MTDRPNSGRPRKYAATLLLGVSASVLLLAGCATRGGSVEYEPEGFGPPDVSAPVSQDGAHLIGALDKLNIAVFQVEELTGEYQIDSRGNLSFPLIGTVPAQGRSTEELARELTALLGKRYLRSPNVQVTIAEATDHTITVDGSVRRPGVLPIRGATSLMRAVALAQGLAEDANPARVIVFRTIDGQRMAAAFDLRAIRRAEAEDPAIFGNDIVIVDGSRARTLFRDVVSSIPMLGVFRPW
jgi:polysaccharide biosynthesis/export protein